MEILDRGDVAEGGAEHRDRVVLVDPNRAPRGFGFDLDGFRAGQRNRPGAGELGVVVGLEGLDARHLTAEQGGVVGLGRGWWHDDLRA